MYRSTISMAMESQARSPYTPTGDLMALRRMMLDVLPASAQQPFHELAAARTPNEWAEREAALFEKLANAEPCRPAGDTAWHTVPRPELPWDRWYSDPPQYVPKYCPACGVATPPPRLGEHVDDSDHPVLRHIKGTHGQEPCTVVGELLHMLNETVRQDKFSDAAVATARASRDAALLQAEAGRAQHAGKRATGRRAADRTRRTQKRPAPL